MTDRPPAEPRGAAGSTSAPGGSDGGRAGGATEERLRYRLLTGPDGDEFCRRVAEALDDGYVLHGAPAITTRHGELWVAQAVVLP